MHARTEAESSNGPTTELDKQLTDERWLLKADLFAEPQRSPRGGRPRAGTRDCLEVSDQVPLA